MRPYVKHKSHKPGKRHAMPRIKDAFSDWISLDIHDQSVSTMVKHGNPLCQVRIAKHFTISRTTRYVLFANASHAKAQIYGKAMENSKTLYYLEDNRYVLFANASHARASNLWQPLCQCD